MLSSDLITEAATGQAKARLVEARARYIKCRSASLRAERGEKLRAQGALQSALRELMQAEIDLERLV